MMNTPGAHRERTPRPAARCNTLDFHGKSCALAEGLALASRADVYTIRCSCKQWPCTYTAPCVARTCWEESQTHIAATLWRRRSTGRRTPSTAHTPTIRPPGGIPDTRSTHPHGSDQTPSRPRWKLCNARSPTRSAPRQHESPPDYQAGQAFSFA